MEIYSPKEDSFFFAEFLKKYLSKQKNKNLTLLDMGTGSGILAQTASKFIKKQNITVADINPDAIKKLKKQGYKAIQSNLFEKIQQKFDLIIFNAPYLPEDPREPKESRLITTGGKNGDEISIKFLEQAKKHLNKNGKIFLLVSSLTPFKQIKKFNPKVIAEKPLFAEKLLILEFE